MKEYINILTLESLIKIQRDDVNPIYGTQMSYHLDMTKEDIKWENKKESLILTLS